MSQKATTPVQGGLKNKLWFNFLLVIVVCVILFMLFFSSLGLMTHHGEETKVPNVTGQSVDEAVKNLTTMGFDVKVDSTYEPTKKALMVLQQMPEVGEIVKTGRALFLTVNKSVPPNTAMPKVVDLTFRSAMLILQSNRLVVGDTILRPDIAKGVVLEQLFDGKQIAPGTMIPQGSIITLVIGDGLGNTEMNVPDVMGMSYVEAVGLLSSNNLLITTVPDPGSSDTAAWIIYNQTPNPMSELGVPSRIREGDGIDIYVAENPADSLIQNYRNKWKANLKAPADSTY